MRNARGSRIELAPEPVKIINYHDAYLDLDRLAREGKSRWFIQGAAAGSRNMGVPTGWSSGRPRAAKLRLRKLRNGWLEVSGKTKSFASHLQRLGGKQKENDVWTFPPSSLTALQSDSELNEKAPWDGVPEEQLRQAHAEYSAGYAWAQELAARIPHSNIARRQWSG